MNSYENLIRKILLSESNPALVLLFATNAVGDKLAGGSGGAGAVL